MRSYYPLVTTYNWYNNVEGKSVHYGGIIEEEKITGMRLLHAGIEIVVRKTLCYDKSRLQSGTVQ